MGKQSRHTVNLGERVFKQLEYARGALHMALGREVANTEVIAFALDSVLTETMPVQMAEELHRKAMVNILGQVITQLRPDLEFRGLAINETRGTATLDLVGLDTPIEFSSSLEAAEKVAATRWN